MKFVTKDGTRFEVSNLTHIVINNVTQIVEPGEAHSDKRKNKPPRLTNKKVRDNGDKGTRVWVKFTFPQTERVKERTRWLKYHDVVNSKPESLDPKAAQQYTQQDDIQQIIQQAMREPHIRVWFSGTYCNIEILNNYQEVQKIRADQERRKAKEIRTFTKPNLNKILAEAMQSSGAKATMRMFKTPFGEIPVMMIQGSGKHANQR